MLFWLHQFYVNMSKTITWRSFFRACEMIFPVVFSENKPSRLWRCLRLFQVLLKTGFILNFKGFFLCLFLVAALKLMIKKLIKYFEFVAVKYHWNAYVSVDIVWMRHVTCACWVNKQIEESFQNTKKECFKCWWLIFMFQYLFFKHFYSVYLR